MATVKILAMNLGSTSTKLAYFEDNQLVLKKSLSHDKADIEAAGSIFGQYNMRKEAIENFMKDNNIKLDELDALVSRGGPTEPIRGGVYVINKAMIDEIDTGFYGIHPCSLGCKIAYNMCEGNKALPLTVDTPSSCEFNRFAFYSGMPDIKRYPAAQPLNGRAMARKYAESIGKKYEDLNLLICILGGGVTVGAHDHGMMVDTQNGIVGDGAFCNNRCNGVPVGQLLDMCFSGKYTAEEMYAKINGKGGLMGYLGTQDALEIENRIMAGDEYAAEVLEAMCYQIAKDIGAYATVLNGKVDQILLIGGMANSKMITDWIRQRVEWIAPVTVMPGEREMESLGENAYLVVTGQQKGQEFIPGGMQ